MEIKAVEIFSEVSNAVILRHPSRHFPGCLIQGDSLFNLLASLEVVQKEKSNLSDEAADELADVIEQLSDWMAHYKTTLARHAIPLPFQTL